MRALRSGSVQELSSVQARRASSGSGCAGQSCWLAYACGIERPAALSHISPSLICSPFPLCAGKAAQIDVRVAKMRGQGVKEEDIAAKKAKDAADHAAAGEFGCDLHGVPLSSSAAL